MSDVDIETTNKGELRIRKVCQDCGDDVAWDHIAFTDAGKILVGHCQCPGQAHSFSIGPKDQVVDARGRRL